MGVMNRVLTILLITILCFVSITMFFNFNDKQVQPELINGFLALCGTELVAMGGIKIFGKQSPKKEPVAKKSKEIKKEEINTEDVIKYLTDLEKKKGE